MYPLVRRFTSQIAESLRLKVKDPGRSAGRTKISISPTHTIGRKPVIPTSIQDIRYDGVAHMPKIDGERSCCGKCVMACTVR